MIILPITLKKPMIKFKTLPMNKSLYSLEAKCTQFPEIDSKANKPICSLVKQYILDSQLLTHSNSNSNKHNKSNSNRTIRTLYQVNSVLTLKSVTSKPNDYNFNICLSNEYNDYNTHQHLKTSFSNKVIINPHNSNRKALIAHKKKKKLVLYNEKRLVHDVNTYNKIFIERDPLQNYVRNAYKITKLFHNDQFLSQIKLDLKSLKFNNQLKLINT